jgi:hypothetical protein
MTAGTMRLVALGIILLALSDPADAADQLVRGKKVIVFKSAGADARRLLCRGRENPTNNTVVGNPTVTGATLQILANGGSDYDQTFTLPAAAWAPVAGGYRYLDASGTNGPVRRVLIRKAGPLFLIKAVGNGSGTTPPPGIAVAPPNPGTDATCILTLTGGDTYCVGFGIGNGGGTINPNTAVNFTVTNPGAAGACPSTTTSTTTTTTSNSTTTTTLTCGGITTGMCGAGPCPLGQSCVYTGGGCLCVDFADVDCTACPTLPGLCPNAGETCDASTCTCS